MRSSVLVSACLFSCVTACASEASVGDRLQECALVSEGELGPRVVSAFYEPSACYQECLSSASCDDLGAALCGTSIELLQRCDQLCAHRCPDGSLIALELVCDGNAQCEGGSDEMGCATFDCGDGVSLIERLRCNGTTNCVSGADEVGCNIFSCVSTWGGSITGDWTRCNGSPECADGSDERDCPEYRCANGATFTHAPSAPPQRCDGWQRCLDGSDEEGCAELTPMCAMP